MLCPVCKIALTMSDRQGIEIDYCPQCRGVWLDRGELDKIIERSQMPSAQAPVCQPELRETAGHVYRGQQGSDHDSRNHHGYDHDERGHYKRRKKSLLGELFDFD